MRRHVRRMEVVVTTSRLYVTIDEGIGGYPPPLSRSMRWPPSVVRVSRSTSRSPPHMSFACWARWCVPVTSASCSRPAFDEGVRSSPSVVRVSRSVGVICASSASHRLLTSVCRLHLVFDGCELCRPPAPLVARVLRSMGACDSSYPRSCPIRSHLAFDKGVQPSVTSRSHAVCSSLTNDVDDDGDICRRQEPAKARTIR